MMMMILNGPIYNDSKLASFREWSRKERKVAIWTHSSITLFYLERHFHFMLRSFFVSNNLSIAFSPFMDQSFSAVKVYIKCSIEMEMGL